MKFSPVWGNDPIWLIPRMDHLGRIQTMNFCIQSQMTGFYIQCTGFWGEDRETAFLFPDLQSAFDFCHHNGIGNVVIVEKVDAGSPTLDYLGIPHPPVALHDRRRLLDSFVRAEDAWEIEDEEYPSAELKNAFFWISQGHQPARPR